MSSDIKEYPGLIVGTAPHNGLDLEGQTNKFLSDVRQMFRGQRQLMPFCLIQTTKPVGLTTVTVLPTISLHHEGVRFIRGLTAELAADALWFAFEAWGVDEAEVGDMSRYRYGDAQQHPKRIEAVYVTREIRHAEQHTHDGWLGRIVRKGRPTVEKWERSETDAVRIAQASLSYLLGYKTDASVAT